MTVSIDIDLDAMGAIQEIAHLKVALKSLEEDLDLDLNLDGDLGDTLDDLSDTMDELSESFNSDLNETIDRLENLEFDDVTVVDGNGDSGGDTGSDSGDDNSRSQIRRMFEAWDRSPKEITARMGGLGDDGGGLNTGIDRDWDTNIRDFKLNADVSGQMFETFDRNPKEILGRMGVSSGYEDTRIGDGLMEDFGFLGGDGRPSILPPDANSDSDKDPGVLGRGYKGLKGFNGKLNRSFKKLIPSMSTWINLLGMAVPALAAMAVQAVGVAAAMGAIAFAGASLIGLGLIGHGDSMAESFRNAKEEINELKQGLFEEFEPTADLFSGIQTEFFDFIPGEVERIATSMQGLMAFEDDIFALFRGGTQFVSQFIGVITENAELIGYLTDKFSTLLGMTILDLFEGLLSTTQENQGMLVALGSTLKIVGVALYEVFLMVSKAIIILAPLFALIAHGAALLNNDFAAGMLAALGLFYLLGSVLPGIYLGFQALGFALQRTTIPAIGSLMSTMAGYITQALVAIGVNGALAASIAAVTTAVLTLAAVSGIGLLISGSGLLGMQGMKSEIPKGGNIPDSYSPAGGGGQTTINEGNTVNVDMRGAGNPEKEKFDDMGGGNGNLGPTGGAYTE